MSCGNKKSYILLKQKPLPTESFNKQCKKLSPNRCILWYPNFGITNENGKNVRPQSFNCSVCLSRLPQFRIRKSNIFGVEKWSFNNCWHVVTRAFFLTQPFIFPQINLFCWVCQYSKSSAVLLNNGHKTCVHFLLTLLNYLCIHICIYL